MDTDQVKAPSLYQSSGTLLVANAQTFSDRPNQGRKGVSDRNSLLGKYNREVSRQ
jgi:hypothetical protein